MARHCAKPRIPAFFPVIISPDHRFAALATGPRSPRRARTVNSSSRGTSPTPQDTYLLRQGVFPCTLNELKALHVSEVLKQAEELEIENTGRMRKQELMFAIIKKRAKAGEQVLRMACWKSPDGFGFLRSPDTSFTASTDDIYISPSQVRRFNLHTGDMIEGEVRTPKDGERYFALTKLDKVNGGPPEQNKHKVMFENLTPLFPKEQMRLERDIKGDENITGRIIDIIAPIGRGQRALIVTAQERQDGDDAAHRPRHRPTTPTCT